MEDEQASAEEEEKSNCVSCRGIYNEAAFTSHPFMVIHYFSHTVWFPCGKMFNQDALRSADVKDYSSQTQESLACWNPDSLGFNLILYLLCNICENERRPGAVLVFMTGWDDINSLKDKLEAHPVLGDNSRVLLLACHGSMASSEQVYLIFWTKYIQEFIPL